MRLVASAEGVDERQTMLAALTTNVTRFFREPHHFEHLASEILPPLLAAVRRAARLRLWSAACSSGQEPYSIALTLLSVIPDAAELDVKILATDIDPNMLAAGAAASMGRRWSRCRRRCASRWFSPLGPARTQECGRRRGSARWSASESSTSSAIGR